MDPYIKTQFEALHSMPELGYQEVRTSAYLADALESMGYQVKRHIGTTGVIGVLDSGVTGPALALRADMDALPFVENGQDVAIHACGHDANSTMVLTAAKRAAERGIRSGRLFIVFQQAEERIGAIQMAESGELSGIEEMVAAHLRPPQEVALGEAACGVIHCATHHIEVEIRGKAAHGARPFLGVNAIEIAAAIIQAASAIHEDSTVSFSLKPTQIESLNGAKNSIPDHCRLVFDLRGETNEVAESLTEKLKTICYKTAEMFGGSIEKFDRTGVLAAMLDPELTKLCDEAISNKLGKSVGVVKTAAGEDIYYFSRMCGIRIAYIGVGANVQYGLHHPKMSFDPRAMEIGADILEQVVELRLGLGR